MDLTDTFHPTSNGTDTPDTETAASGSGNDANGLSTKEENKFQQAIASWRSAWRNFEAPFAHMLMEQQTST